MGEVDVPPEVYLRQFRDTPTDDLDALAELCLLGMVPPYPTDVPARMWSDLPVYSRWEWTVMLAKFSVPLSPAGWAGWEPWTNKVWAGDENERAEARRRHPDHWPIHAAEVAVRTRAVQRCTDHLLAHASGEPVAQAWPPEIADEHEAWDMFTRFTNAALRDFHVRVTVPTETYDLGEFSTTLYSAAMLQLVNDLTAGETVHACANETCGKPFIRQLGRSQYGGNRRIGTLYCSKLCARAQYQREKRRRDRAERVDSRHRSEVRKTVAQPVDTSARNTYGTVGSVITAV
jgi:hypothetical protein